jgi:Predicted transcriptional regulators
MIEFTSGEFAQICGVKKATLFHYDEIGLLKPSLVGENGYRYYTDKDVYTYDVIAAFKEVGYSLGEIAAYLDARDTESYLSMLEQGRKLLAEERRRIESLDRLFASSIATTMSACESRVGAVRIVRCEEEYLIVHEAARDPEANYAEIFLRAREHIDYCRERNLTQSMPIGLIIEAGQLDQGTARESWYFTKVHRKMKDSHFRIKPSGDYAELYHRGPYESLPQACRRLRSGIAKRCLSMAGDIYEEDQLSFFTEKDPSRYLVKLSVAVAPARRGRASRPARNA